MPDNSPPRHGAGAIVAVFGAAFLAMVDLSISAVAMPAIRDDLHASLSGLQWIFDCYTLAFAGLLMVGGTISDRLGHRTGLIASTALFTLGSVVCVAADGVWLLIVGRSVQGAAAAMLVPASMAMISQLAPEPERKAKLLGAWGGLSGVAIALGPLLGGWFVHLSGWRLIFGFNIAAGVLLLVLILAAAPKVVPGEGGSLDVPGLVLGVLWPTALAYSLIEGHAQGWSAPGVLAGFVVGALALAVFVVVEVRAEHPMMPVRSFTSRVFAASNLVAAVLGFALSAAYYFLSLYIQQVLGHDALDAGFGFLPGALGLMFCAPLAGKLVKQVGARSLITGGLLLGAVGLFGLSTLGADSGYWASWWAVALVGVGLGLALPANTTQALTSLPPERAGAASGTVETSMQLGTVLGIAVLGTVQATGFTGDLRDRLRGESVTGHALDRAVDDATASRPLSVPGVAADRLHDLVTGAFAHGLHLAFFTAFAVSAATGVVAFVLLPRRSAADTPDAESSEPPKVAVDATVDAAADAPGAADAPNRDG